MAAERGVELEWVNANEDLIARADELIGAQLADRKHFGDHTMMGLCDEVLDIMMKGLNLRKGTGAPGSSETSSVLLLGESGAGKTHIVEWCLGQLREVQKSLVVLRAIGGAYATDVECIRHLAAQVADQLVTAPHANASFEQGMDWIRSVLRESFQHASAVVIVLDKFEHFCSRARQTLLYNLFDIAQEVGVHLSIVGMSEKMDVIGMLEKRIKSRFSMRHLHAFQPSNMEDLVKVLMVKLRLPDDCGLKKPFLKQLSKNLEAALMANKKRWMRHITLERPPTWFLYHCLPILGLLRNAAQGAEGATKAPKEPTKEPKEPATPPPKARGRLLDQLSDEKEPDLKRQRTTERRRSALAGYLPSATKMDVKMLLVEGLSEAEHIVMLALHRMHSRQAATRTLSLVLHEIQLLHESGNFLTAAAHQDRYCSAFDRLVQMKLVELCVGQGAGDVSKRYTPCESLLDQFYARMVQDLARSSQTPGWNPLRVLPQQVQQWAVLQRKA